MNYFDRLRSAAERIAHHSYYPGKEQAVGQAIEDLDDLVLGGLINVEQRDVLREVLMG